VNGELARALLDVSEQVGTAGNWVTPVAEAFEGVSAVEAAWKPTPDERSIWEIANHMIVWTDWAVGFVQGRDTAPVEWPPVGGGDEADWLDTHRRLTDANAALHEQVGRLNDADLFEKPTPEVTETNRFLGIASILVHNAYHSGQVTKLREQYRRQRTDD
jgi:hypothetical protein